MARLYADEQFPLPVVELLRGLGHDILTVQEAGKANLGIPDGEVLAFAVSNERAVLTLNRFDFIGLHRLQPDHSGIIVCTDDQDIERLASRINEAISNVETWRGRLIPCEPSVRVRKERDRPLSSRSAIAPSPHLANPQSL